MKNKTLLKAVKIALVACVMLTACIVPAFAETATTPEYNGYIPEGEYVVTSLPSSEYCLEGYDSDGYQIFFLTFGDNEYNTINSSSVAEYFIFLDDAYGVSTNVYSGDTFIVNQKYYCTESEFNDFMQYFTLIPEPEPEPEPPTNIYQTCYDLINTYLYGGSVVVNTYNDLVCITLATLSCVLVYAFPFIVVFAFLKVWFF